ncbi:MAG: ribonuclease [Lachnospiraceae bacterium]|nr:ribonuclease [Lachnospiraceae bacterium]
MVEEDGWYSTKDEVALYIYLYGELPDNFITKNEARDLGWESSEGNLWEVADGMSIGGDRYYNSDDQLPEIKGRKYYECDINYNGGFRGAERIVYSNDGLIYYTGDHYESFECLYGEE